MRFARIWADVPGSSADRANNFNGKDVWLSLGDAATYSFLDVDTVAAQHREVGVPLTQASRNAQPIRFDTNALHVLPTWTDSNKKKLGDGSSATAWEAAPADGKHIKVELGELTLFDKVVDATVRGHTFDTRTAETAQDCAQACLDAGVACKSFEYRVDGSFRCQLKIVSAAAFSERKTDHYQKREGRAKKMRLLLHEITGVEIEWGVKHGVVGRPETLLIEYSKTGFLWQTLCRKVLKSTSPDALVADADGSAMERLYVGCGDGSESVDGRFVKISMEGRFNDAVSESKYVYVIKELHILEVRPKPEIREWDEEQSWRTGRERVVATLRKMSWGPADGSGVVSQGKNKYGHMFLVAESTADGPKYRYTLRHHMGHHERMDPIRQPANGFKLTATGLGPDAFLYWSYFFTSFRPLDSVGRPLWYPKNMARANQTAGSGETIVATSVDEKARLGEVDVPAAGATSGWRRLWEEYGFGDLDGPGAASSRPRRLQSGPLDIKQMPWTFSKPPGEAAAGFFTFIQPHRDGGKAVRASDISFNQHNFPPPPPPPPPPPEPPRLWSDFRAWVNTTNNIANPFCVRDPEDPTRLAPNGAMKSYDATHGVPGTGDDAWIPASRTVIFDLESSPDLHHLVVEGELVFKSDAALLDLRAEYITIKGGSISVGSSAAPFAGAASITLLGDRDSEFIKLGSEGIEVGQKVLAVGGNLTMVGLPRTTARALLRAPVAAGDNALDVEGDVDWRAGDHLVVPPTGYTPSDTEMVEVAATERLVDGGTGAAYTRVTLTAPLAHPHHSFADSPGYDAAAGGAVPFGSRAIKLGVWVGLLSRNVQIRGGDTGRDRRTGKTFVPMGTSEMGASVAVVAAWSEPRVACPAGTAVSCFGFQKWFGGTLHLEHVEFVDAAQNGANAAIEWKQGAYRYGGAAAAPGDSVVRDCAFRRNRGWGLRLQAGGPRRITIDNNVLYRTLGCAVAINAGSVASLATAVDVTNNYAVLGINAGTHLGRKGGNGDKKARRDSAEDFSQLGAPIFTAMSWILIPAHCFAVSWQVWALFDDLTKVGTAAAAAITMQDNIAAGSERAGFFSAGVPCAEAEAAGGAARWSGNVAHTALFGFQLLPLMQAACTAITGIHTFKILNHAFYSENMLSQQLQVYDIAAADAKYGLWFQTVGCNPVDHVRCDKVVSIKNALLVGATDHDRDCAARRGPAEPDSYMCKAVEAKCYALNRWSAGIAIPSFVKKVNKAPFMASWNHENVFGALGGQTVVDGITFAKWGGKNCNHGRNFAVRTRMSPDVDAPISFKNVEHVEMSENGKSLLHFDRPLSAWVNHADCIDMDCDGLKHQIVRDLDGSLLGLGPGGAGATVFSRAELINDVALAGTNIPAQMLVDAATGQAIAEEDAAPHGLGTFRRNCTGAFAGADPARSTAFDLVQPGFAASLPTSWQAWVCPPSLKFRHMWIEMMDVDRLRRRISPTAISSGGYTARQDLQRTFVV